MADEAVDHKAAYAAPRVLASYSKEELADVIRPHGPVPDYSDPGCGGGCGCGCGCAAP